MGQSAPLRAITVTSPGAFGLNKQNSGSLLPAQWATEALNCVFDDANRLSSREGWLTLTTTPISGTPDLDVVFEYIKNSTGATYIVSAGGNALYSGTTAPTAVTGALTITADNWKFTNFNDKVYGIQTGHPLIEWAGTGNFVATTASTGSVPDGNEILGAYGRLWGTSANGQTIKYSGLLDGTYWTGTGAGSITLTSIWPSGADKIIALAAFNSMLVVFGERNIILYADNSGSEIGLNPSNIVAIDVIAGIGCIARDSVQNINGDDLVFLSHSGLMSLRRIIQESGSPLRDISKNNRDYINALRNVNGVTTLRSTFNPYKGLYLLLMPTAGRIFCFDTKVMLEDGTWRTTEWDSFIPYSLCTLSDGKTTYSGIDGEIYTYTGSQDDTRSYTYKFHTPWILNDPEVQDTYKTLKRIESIQKVSGSTTLTYKWFLDFSDTFYSATKAISGGDSGGEWYLAEFSLSEYGGAFGLVEVEVPAKKAGQFIKLGVETEIDGNTFSLNQLQYFAKFGRIT